MISLQNISLRLGTQLLLEQASLQIIGGQKLGIIGRNGSGKTSLFKLLMAEVTADEGELQIQPGLKKSHMLQETAGSQKRAVDHVMDGDFQYRALEKDLARAEEKDDFQAMAQLHAQLEVIDAYSIASRAQQLMSGLGFTPEQFDLPLAEFSGGWRIRLNLAQALIQNSDLLLLDEPTNHLDIEAAIWLEQWLQAYRGTLLLISHDRHFLDGVVGHIVSFENRKLILYRGNYSAYEKQKVERLAQQQAVYEKQQQRKHEIEDFVRRFRAKASKAKQAQSRLKELNRMADIAPAHVDSPFHFSFPEPDKMPASLITCEHLDIGYQQPLIRDFSLNITPDSRIALLGPNGRGKSTLLKTLCGQQRALKGKVNYSDHLQIGYCAQHQIDELDSQATPMQLMQRLDPEVRQQEIRNFLGGFDFRGERIDESIEHFSGGEKSRLALALVVWQKPNLLLLDEPTNHLDLEMCHALTLALQAYQGALLLVSHDQYLLNNVADEFLLIKDGKLEFFDGSLGDYEKFLLAGNRDGQHQGNSGAGKNDGYDSKDKKAQRQEAAEQRRQLQPLRNRIKKLEQDIHRITQRLEKIEGQLAGSEIYEEKHKSTLNGLLQEQGSLAQELSGLEEEWFGLSEELEGLQELSQNH